MGKVICVECDSEFDTHDKIARAKREMVPAGKHNQCIDCATPDKEPVFTGVMISGTKTASAIQINRDPELTRYMLDTSPSAGSRHAMVRVAPKPKDRMVVVHVHDVAKRRE